MARDGAASVFDGVMAKPFQPAELFERIEALLRNPELEASTQGALGLWRANGLDRRPRAVATPAPSPAQMLALSPYFEMVASPASADALLLLDQGKLADLAALRRHGAAHLLPTIYLTSARSRELDAAFSPGDPDSWAAVANAVRGFQTRAARLAPALRFSSEPGARLLAQLFVSERALEPVPDPRDRRLFCYSGAVGDGAPAVAEDLVSKGLLNRNFAERFHVCGDCQSHRLNVREECPSCRSSDIETVKLLRHFRCATVTPEDDCRTDGWFSCPTCRQPLGRLGNDYARAGDCVRCGGCGAAHGAASVGFVCLYCEAHVRGEEVATRDVHAYVPTMRAIALLTAPATIQAPVEAVERVVAARREGRRSILAELKFSSAEMLKAAEGDAAFEALRRGFAEMVAAAFGEDAHPVEGALGLPRRHRPPAGGVLRGARRGAAQVRGALRPAARRAPFDPPGGLTTVPHPCPERRPMSVVQYLSLVAREACADDALDLAKVAEVEGLLGETTVTAMLTRFARDIGDRLSDRRMALDAVHVAADAHACVSSAGFLGFAALSGACAALEQACRQNAAIDRPSAAVRAERDRALSLLASLQATRAAA